MFIEKLISDLQINMLSVFTDLKNIGLDTKMAKIHHQQTELKKYASQDFWRPQDSNPHFTKKGGTSSNFIRFQ